MRRRRREQNDLKYVDRFFNVKKTRLSSVKHRLTDIVDNHHDGDHAVVDKVE